MTPAEALGYGILGAVAVLVFLAIIDALITWGLSHGR